MCIPLSPEAKTPLISCFVEWWCLVLIIATMGYAVGMLLCLDSPKHAIFEIHSFTVHQKLILFITN